MFETKETKFESVATGPSIGLDFSIPHLQCMYID